MWAGLLDLLFPPRCAGCGGRGEPFCAACKDRLRWILPPICPRCGRPYLGFSAAFMDGNPFALRPELTAPALWCPSCRRGPPAFAVARSVAAYEGGLREAICALKFHRKRAVAEPLGRLLARFAPQEVFHMVDAIVPVPLHQNRFAQRGFNQSELLARHVAIAAAAPCLPEALRRVRQEVAQAELGAVDRWHNVDGAFAPGLRVRGTVLLVDDVFSTGATAAACSRALAEAGAERVVVLTLARAVLRRYHGALLRPPVPHLAAEKQPLPP